MLDKKKLKELKKRAAKFNSVVDEEPKGIPCSFIKRENYAYVVEEEDSGGKCGQYHGSVWPEVKDFGLKRWVVGGYVAVDYERYRSLGYTDEEIVRGCVEFLNCPPKRKKYAKRTPRPLYGNLEDMPVRHKFMEKAGKKCIMMCLVTNQRKNKHFLGEGQNFVTHKTRRR